MEVNVEKWNEMISNATPSLPRYGYYLADYDEIPVMTLAPVSVGDYFTIKEDEDSGPVQRRVKKILHLETTTNVGDGLFTPFIYFED